MFLPPYPPYPPFPPPQRQLSYWQLRRLVSERFGLLVAAPASSAQAQRQVRLCQRMLDQASIAEAERLTPRERRLVREQIHL